MITPKCHLLLRKGYLKVLLGMTIFTLLQVSCLDKIEIVIPKAVRDGLVIEGKLTQGEPSHVLISITRIFDFTANSRKPVNVREVFLFDDQDNRIEIPERLTGVYELDLDRSVFPVEVGRSYGITIATQDGRQLRSALDPLLAVPKAESISLVETTREVTNSIGEPEDVPYFEFSVETPAGSSEPGKKARLQWEFERTYKLTDSPQIVAPGEPKTCFITEAVEVQDISILDVNLLTGTDRVQFPVFETPINFRFAEGFYLTIYQQSLSEGAYNYWSQVSQVLERTGNMFETPAGKIRSNISNVEEGSEDEIFGYFYATQRDTIRLFVSPETANNPAKFCPGPPSIAPPGGGCPRVPCCDCLVERGSSSVKPSFWID